MNRIVLSALLAASIVAPAAAGTPPVQPAGTIVSATPNVFVVREGKTLRAYKGLKLMRGDRVVTRGAAVARVEVDGCGATQISPTTTLINTSCAAPAMMQAGPTGPSTTTLVLTGTVIAGTVAGAIALSNNNTPVSP